jgi:hypothetical protein
MVISTIANNNYDNSNTFVQFELADGEDDNWNVPNGVYVVNFALYTSDTIIYYTGSDSSNPVVYTNLNYNIQRVGDDFFVRIYEVADDLYLTVVGTDGSSDYNIVPSSETNTGDFVGVKVGWTTACPKSYTNLHSDFDPELDTALSKLKLDNGQPKVDIVFYLPEYYYGVSVTYDVCANGEPTLDISAGHGTDGCKTRYTASINYVQADCSFDLAQDSNGDNYSYSGTLRIKAKLILKVGASAGVTSFDVERIVESPLSWVTYIQRTVTVNSNIILNNTDTCSQDSDCGPTGDGLLEIPAAPTSAVGPQGCCEYVADVNNYQCNCDCATNGNGYNGRYCENDNEPPTCSIGVAPGSFVDLTYDSPNGGCVLLDDILGEIAQPTFSDNSGTYYVARRTTYTDTPMYDGWVGFMDSGITTEDYTDCGTLNGPNDDCSLATPICLPVGTHIIEWHVRDVYNLYDNVGYSVPDVPGGVWTNEHTSCGYVIEISDKSEPYVDCQYCQEDFSGTIKLCVDGSLVTTPLADALQYFDEDSGYTDVTFAGDVYNCDCTAVAVEPYFQGYLQSFLDYAPPVYFDIYHDGSWTWIQDEGNFTNGIPDEGYQNQRYSMEDGFGNQGECNILHVYDPTPPTCPDLDLGTVNVAQVPHPIHADTQIYGNYTDAVNFLALQADNVLLINADKAGIAPYDPLTDDAIHYPFQLGNLHFNGNDLGYQPTEGDTYYLPVDAPLGTGVYTATYSLTDRAGNVGYCEWKLTVQNPDPCLWPDCEDRPPQCNNVPGYIQKYCTASSCGCGEFTIPSDVIIDDREVQYLDYSPTETDLLTLGNNTITITGADYQYLVNGNADHLVECTFVVNYKDIESPQHDVFDCPTNETLSTDPNLFDLNGNYGTSVEYTYEIDAIDDCILNEHTAIQGGKVGGAESRDEYSGNYAGIQETVTLTVGTTSFSYFIEDSSDNKKYCTWTIIVEDNYPPEITCPDDYYLRIDQGSASEGYNWAATASDTVDGNLDDSIVYTLDGTTITNAYEWDTAGTYTILANVSDTAGNWDACSWDVTVAEPYPYIDFIPTLTRADISLTSQLYSDDADREFQAELEITIIINEYHIVESLTYADDNTISPVDLGQDCLSIAPACYYKYDLTVPFSDCTSQQRNYNFLADVDCVGIEATSGEIEDVCIENPTDESFTATLTASDYCWQSLGTIDIDASLTMHSAAQYNGWNGDPNTLPAQTSAFSNLDDIYGVVVVTSTQLTNDIFNGVTIETATKTFYEDAAYTTEVGFTYTSNLFNDGSYADGSQDNVAWFLYAETEVPLETLLYTKYDLSLSVDALNLGRRLLNVRHTLQNDDENVELLTDASAEAFMSSENYAVNSGSTSNGNNDNNAIIVMMLNNCASTESDWEESLTYVIAEFLRIASDRVNSVIEATSEGHCLLEVSIEQVECEGTVDIITLLEYLEQGVYSESSDLHVSINGELPNDITLDDEMFFVIQEPNLLIHSAISLGSSDDGSVSDEANNVPWYYTVALGFTIGLIASFIGYYAILKKRSHDESQPVRKMSVNDLLVEAQRRSSLDGNNVRLHKRSSTFMGAFNPKKPFSRRADMLVY